MKTFQLFAALSLVAFAHTLDAQSDKAAVARVTQTMDDFSKYDAAAFGSNFTEDAVIVNPLGMVFKSRQEVVAVHEQVFKSWGPAPTSATYKIESQTIKTLADDLTLVTTMAEHSGDPKSGEGKLVYSMLMKKVGAEWLIAFAQVTPAMDPSVMNH